MKKLKLITALIAIFFFSGLLFAGNPDNLATITVGKLNADISLTDSQKVIIQANAKELFVQMQKANSLTNKTDISTDKKLAYEQYKATLDSVLTREQKAQLITKQNERRRAIENKYKANK
jgi:hypothetical protein